ncbi:MAG: SRPBCC domain-containing protein [Deltaproteobacteria bacterium]|nr:SRPBCC domain-containing protein [Deltaproteobacteria bacterium]
MAVVENEILIRATPAQVWAVLTDTARYAQWNPRLKRIEGELATGAVVTLHYAKDRPWLPSRFVVDVDVCASERELRWSGPRNGGRRLLRASHWFRLSPHDEGTLLVHGERFEGALARIVWAALGRPVAANHADVNVAIRSRCESDVVSEHDGSAREGLC